MARRSSKETSRVPVLESASIRECQYLRVPVLESASTRECQYSRVLDALLLASVDARVCE